MQIENLKVIIITENWTKEFVQNFSSTDEKKLSKLGWTRERLKLWEAGNAGEHNSNSNKTRRNM